MSKGYEDLNWEQRQRFHRRAASLNKLAALFGLTFRYVFETEVAEPFVRADQCIVPTNYQGEP